MNDYELFPHAPITEAIFDIRATLPAGTKAEQLKLWPDEVLSRFPEKQTQFMMKKALLFKGDDSSMESQGAVVNGYLFKSAAEQKVVQGRLDGFTYNKLKPYESWDRFQAEGRELWKYYKQIASPETVVRIALRFINVIQVPLPLSDFKEYLCNTPEVASNLPQTLSSFLMRIEFPNEDIGARAIITQTMKPPTHDNKLPLVLDIDVIKNVALSVDSEMLWEDFESLRTFKNDIFFNSITEKAKELFR